MANSDYPNLPPSPVLIPATALLQRKLPNDTPLLYALLGSGTPPYKMSPGDAQYGTPPVRAQTCGNCVRAFQHVTSKAYICDQIRGPIEPGAWCRLWKAA